jgi:hypothetical protein
LINHEGLVVRKIRNKEPAKSWGKSGLFSTFTTIYNDQPNKSIDDLASTIKLIQECDASVLVVEIRTHKFFYPRFGRLSVGIAQSEAAG